MMAINTDKNSYTIIFSIIMVVVVGSLLAGFASGLKPTINANERIEKQQNILYAMGVNDNEGKNDVVFTAKDKVESIFSEIITRQLVIQGDKISEDEKAYLIDIKKEATKAKNPDYDRRLPLFIGQIDGKEVYVLPVRGKRIMGCHLGLCSFR